MTFGSQADTPHARGPRRLVLVAVAFAAMTSPAASLVASGTPAARCALPVGQRVVLQSDAADPDVFLWDTRARLVAYVAGGWDSAREVMDHTLLASPGTNALVISCAPGAAHPRYTADAVDAVGVKVLRGVFRGHFGWIVATDARALGAPSNAHASR